MERLSRADIFDPSEIAAVHGMARTNRRFFLLRDDQLTGMNFDHSKRWSEDKLKQLAANFEIGKQSTQWQANEGKLHHKPLRSLNDSA